MHPTLARLDRFAATLAVDPHACAVLGLGSAGVQTDRFDDHSDIDFFLVVDDPATKQRYLDDITWLTGFGGQPVYSFTNDPNGRKVLFEDGLFLEYAIFTPAELAAVPYTGARIVWRRPPFGLDPDDRASLPATAIDTIDFHLNEALTNLYVGLHRQLRGEHLTAMRFVQVYAVDRVLALVRLTSGAALQQPDQFEPTRRIERATLPEPLPLTAMIAGYAHNLCAAKAILGWLTTHHDTAPVIVEAITGLVAQVAQADQWDESARG